MQRAKGRAAEPERRAGVACAMPGAILGPTGSHDSLLSRDRQTQTHKHIERQRQTEGGRTV